MVLNRVCRREADTRFAALRKQVTIQVFTHRFEDAECRETRQSAQELAEASSRISVEINEATESGDLLRKYRIDSIPSLVISAKNVPELRLYGFPLVYAFNILLDLVCVAGSSSEPKDELSALFMKALDNNDAAVAGRAVSNIDLLVSRREPASVEAAAALIRSVYAHEQVFKTGRLCVSIRILENELRWALPFSNSRLPLLVQDGTATLSWPFTDLDLCNAILQSGIK